MRESRLRSLGVDPDSVGGEGGNTITALAAAALLTGDVVFHTAVANSVNKSGTQADYQKFAGVVVGGGSSFGRDLSLNGSDAVNISIPSGKAVVLQVDGIVWCVAGGVIAAGDKVTGDTATPGRVITGAGAIAGQTIGTAMSATTAAGQAVKVRISFR